jgi:hypothetical protein
MSRQRKEDANFFSDILLPFLGVGLFLAGVVYVVLKLVRVMF